MCTQEGISSSTGVAFGSTEVGCIAVGPQDNVAGVVSNDSSGMCCTVIEEVCEVLEGGLHAGGLLGGKGAKCH